MARHFRPPLRSDIPLHNHRVAGYTLAQEVNHLSGVEAAIMSIVTFIVIVAFMVAMGVDATVAALIGGAAVFGELILTAHFDVSL